MTRRIALALFLLGCAPLRPDDASIAPPTRIVVGSDATPAERAAAEMLSRELHIEPAYSPGTSDGGTLFVGRSAALDARRPGIDWTSLGGEGFVLETVGNDLVVAGGRPRGTRYAAEELLARLGRKVLAADCVIAPRPPARIPKLHVRVVPRLEYREPLFTEAFDPAFAVSNRANGEQSRLGDAEGGSVSYTHFVHTAYEIVPPSKYFAEHPEYFALVDGKRVGENAQLCLTNPDVLRIATDTVKGWLRDSPQASIVSVSQNDCFHPCACDACRAIDDREGSHAGSLLAFVNAVAEAIEPEFPDKAVDTLAYQYTRKPPRTIRPRKNVIVRLCSIECCFAHPLQTCEKNASFRDDLVAWSKLTDRLYVWDYATNFAHYLQPLPNCGVLAANVRFYADHGVRGIFEEGDYAPGGGGEMARLKSYLVARAMWDPEVDAAAARAEFLGGYFGKAAEPIGRWLDRLQEAASKPGVHATIYDGPSAPYLSDDVLLSGELDFTEAELAAENQTIRDRVNAAALGVRYVRLMRADVEHRRKLLPEFAADARAAGIKMISEGETLDAFVERLSK